ncbi:MAG: sulfotransferase, partial [Candidatus Promineifilaceae bacterium]
MQNNPVYVAGLERSGTSLMYALLASHPRIAMTRRTNMWTHFYNQYGDLAN